MKKVFLLAAVAFATSANAQVVQFDSEAMGMTDTAAEFAEGVRLLREAFDTTRLQTSRTTTTT